ncbi:MAG: hypothetical protein HRT89_09055 [Lentisphaeria bacterium]|nr:hypothetical protein [Lentisphaeria bacterium]NQZ68206.1 hypothetical protein [Lentisphaeria bacterium]
MSDLLCQWASDFSAETWGKIKLAHNSKYFKIYETTITQNMIYESIVNDFGKISIQEAVDESRNGNDLEVFIKVGSKYKRFAVQAKISYRTEKYKSISHRGNSGLCQIFDLVLYAKREKAIPLYFLYTYSKGYLEDIKINGSLACEYGVSVINAHTIFWNYFNSSENKFKKIPSVSDLIERDDLYTFSEFLCNKKCLNKLERSIFNPVGKLPDTKEIKAINYDYDESFLDDDNWMNIDSKSHTQKYSTSINNDTGFNPGHRIIIDT